MAPELINPVAVEELPAWSRAMSTTFLHDPHDPAAAQHVEVLRRAWSPERAWGAMDRGRWVATLRTTPRTITVPGAGEETLELPVDALTHVTVAANHRRRGLLTQMLTESLAAARERGDAASVLIAAEWPIYGRFGYAPATFSANYVLHRHRAGARLRAGDPSRLRQVEREEFAAVAPAVFDAARCLRAGQIDRASPWWESRLGGNGYAPSAGLPVNWFLSEGEAGPDGLLAWSPRGEFGLLPPNASVTTWGPFAATEAAYASLWAYLAGLDVVDRVEVSERPTDEPVRWLLADARTLVMAQHVDFLWLRLLDVPAALSARRYAVADELVLQVLDDSAGAHAAGRFRLVAGDGEVGCAATSAGADVTVTARALASIYLGGVRLRQLGSGAAEEATPGAIQRLDLLFSTPWQPWNATSF